MLRFLLQTQKENVLWILPTKDQYEHNTKVKGSWRVILPLSWMFCFVENQNHVKVTSAGKNGPTGRYRLLGGRCVSPLGFWFIGLLSADVKACTLARDRTLNWFFMLSAENSHYWLIICGNNSPVRREAVKLGHGLLQGYRRWILRVVWWLRARVATLGVQVCAIMVPTDAHKLLF